jgi:hypothetical protein
MMTAGAALCLAAGCAETGATPGAQPDVSAEPVLPVEYLGVETRKLDDTLVSFLVRMKGAQGNDDVAAYGKCAAAQYALIRGYGFARHVRTNVQERGGIWAADAVYTISASLPDGLAPLDAEIVVEDCAANGIPTV